MTKWQLKVPGMGGAAATGCATYRVPSGTSRAKSEGVFSAQASIPGIQLVAGRTGPNAAGIMPKVHDMLRTLLPLCWELQLPFGLYQPPSPRKKITPLSDGFTPDLSPKGEVSFMEIFVGGPREQTTD